MKKQLFSFVLTLCVGLSAQAQVKIIPAISIGYHWDNYKYSNSSYIFSGVGTRIGSQFEFDIYDSNFSINPALYYSNLNIIDRTLLNEEVREVKNMLSIPIVVNYYFGTNQSGFFLGAGPQMNIFLGGTGRVGSDSFTLDKSIYRPVSLSINANIGYQFDMGFRISAFSDFGVTDTSPDEDSSEMTSYAGVEFAFRF